MKARITEREARECFPLLGIGYCEAQFLLNYQTPIYYTAGMYGWKSDIYRIDNGNRDFYISTGYGYNGERPDYKLVRTYDDKARKIYCSNYDYKNKKTRINKLLIEFIQKAWENVNKK